MSRGCRNKSKSSATDSLLSAANTVAFMLMQIKRCSPSVAAMEKKGAFDSTVWTALSHSTLNFFFQVSVTITSDSPSVTVLQHDSEDESRGSESRLRMWSDDKNEGCPTLCVMGVCVATWEQWTGRSPASSGLPVLFCRGYSWQETSGLVLLVCLAHLCSHMQTNDEFDV